MKYTGSLKSKNNPEAVGLFISMIAKSTPWRDLAFFSCFRVSRKLIVLPASSIDVRFGLGSGFGSVAVWLVGSVVGLLFVDTFCPL